MKIIISHDVDHLYVSEHIFKDLILEKMFIRSMIQLFRNEIELRTCFYRMTMLFRRRMNRISEVMEFDKKHHIPSVFFFGMDNGLGMSYSKNKAISYIGYVSKNGFDVGVHGIEYKDFEKIRMEHDRFQAIVKNPIFGIRNHYVRYDNDTFVKMNQAGYLFDSTCFDKNMLQVRSPYKVGDMWEFPLHIMDGYVCLPGRLKEGIEHTISLIEEAREKGLPYCTILFHDYLFDDRFDPQRKLWYEKTVEYCEQNGYEFVSYRDAIKELEDAQND